MIRSVLLNEGYAESQMLRFLAVSHDEGFKTPREFLLAFRAAISEYVTWYVKDVTSRGGYNPAISSIEDFWDKLLIDDIDFCYYYDWFAERGWRLGNFDHAAVTVYNVQEFFFQEEDSAFMYCWDLKHNPIPINEDD